MINNGVINLINEELKIKNDLITVEQSAKGLPQPNLESLESLQDDLQTKDKDASQQSERALTGLSKRIQEYTLRINECQKAFGRGPTNFLPSPHKEIFDRNGYAMQILLSKLDIRNRTLEMVKLVGKEMENIKYYKEMIMLLPPYIGMGSSQRKLLD